MMLGHGEGHLDDRPVAPMADDAGLGHAATAVERTPRHVADLVDEDEIAHEAVGHERLGGEEAEAAALG